MKIKIVWLGEVIHGGFTQDAIIESAEKVNCKCGNNCWRVNHFIGGYSEILHEVELYTETRPYGYWVESVLSTDDTGKVTESFRLVSHMSKDESGNFIDESIYEILGGWNNYHKSMNHIWVKSLNLFGGYWRDDNGNTFELM